MSNKHLLMWKLMGQSTPNCNHCHWCNVYTAHLPGSPNILDYCKKIDFVGIRKLKGVYKFFKICVTGPQGPGSEWYDGSRKGWHTVAEICSNFKKEK